MVFIIGNTKPGWVSFNIKYWATTHATERYVFTDIKKPRYQKMRDCFASSFYFQMRTA